MNGYLWTHMHDWFVRNVPEQVFFTAVGAAVVVSAVVIAALRMTMLG